MSVAQKGQQGPKVITFSLVAFSNALMKAFISRDQSVGPLIQKRNKRTDPNL